MNLESQKNLIHDTNWDVMIILDACRYDFFEDIFSDYLKGDLKIVKSEGTSTRDWLKYTWNKKYKITYYSANPYINSAGIPFKGFKATERFSKIVDVWDEGWNTKYNTVLPETMTSFYDGKTPSIIHYIQPHRPLLSLDDEGGINMKVQGDGKSIGQKLWSFLNRKLGERRFKSIYRLFRGEAGVSGYERLIRKYGFIKVCEAYKNNLIRVLESVSDLIEGLEGEIIVTSDHGEVFGKNHIYGHSYNAEIPELRKVPWLKIVK